MLEMLVARQKICVIGDCGRIDDGISHGEFMFAGYLGRQERDAAVQGGDDARHREGQKAIADAFPAFAIEPFGQLVLNDRRNDAVLGLGEIVRQGIPRFAAKQPFDPGGRIDDPF